MFRPFPIAALMTVLAAAPAWAQSTSVRVRGTVEAVDARAVTVKTRDGATESVALPETPRVSAVSRKSAADIGPGSFVGAVSLPGPDGTLRATAISILPEASRASGGAHFPWDLEPDSTMTNATVADATSGVQGGRLRVTYKDGEKTVLVSPETTIVGFESATLADVKPGAKVVVFATRSPSGLAATNVVIGRDVDPPM